MHLSTVSSSARSRAARSRSSMSTRPASTAGCAGRSRSCCDCRQRESGLRSCGPATTWRAASKASRFRRRSVFRTVALSAFAAVVIAADWLRFEEPRLGGGRAFALAVLAIAPALLRPLWLRLLAVAVTGVLAVWVAFGIAPVTLWPGGHGFFGPLGSRFGRGFLDFYDFRLPIDPRVHVRMHEVILIAVF